MCRFLLHGLRCYCLSGDLTHELIFCRNAEKNRWPIRIFNAGWSGQQWCWTVKIMCFMKVSYVSCRPSTASHQIPRKKNTHEKLDWFSFTLPAPDTPNKGQNRRVQTNREQASIPTRLAATNVATHTANWIRVIQFARHSIRHCVGRTFTYNNRAHDHRTWQGRLTKKAKTCDQTCFFSQIVHAIFVGARCCPRLVCPPISGKKYSDRVSLENYRHWRIQYAASSPLSSRRSKQMVVDGNLEKK